MPDGSPASVLPPQSFPGVDQLDWLGLRDVARVHDAVMELRPWWTPRHAAMPAFTLGVAMYTDGTGARLGRYQRQAAVQRPFLWHAFGWLYRDLCSLLEAYLGEPVALASHLALPGFHIFLAHPDIPKMHSSVHRDMQHLALPWTGEDGMDPQGTLSFTLCIRMPRWGAGMDVWPVHHRDVQHLPERDLVNAVKGVRPVFVPYHVGGLALHHGMWLHRIARTPQVHVSDARITLQGHGTRCAEGWRLYW